MKRSKLVLHVGCGNSNFQEGMANDGYQLVNVSQPYTIRSPGVAITRPLLESAAARGRRARGAGGAAQALPHTRLHAACRRTPPQHQPTTTPLTTSYCHCTDGHIRGCHQPDAEEACGHAGAALRGLRLPRVRRGPGATRRGVCGDSGGECRCKARELQTGAF